MDIVYHKSRSTVYPELVDTTSSKTTVYLRKNVEEVVEHDEMSDQDVTMYVYDEATLTKSEYALYLATLSSDEANTAAQLAIAELAEMVESQNTAIQLAMAELAEAMMS